MMDDRAADSGVATAVMLFGLTLAEVNAIVSILAGTAAIISALAAAYYYVKKARQVGNGRNDKTESG